MLFRSLVIIALLSCFILCGLNARAAMGTNAATATVRVRGEAAARNELLTLDEIAEIETGDPILRARLGALSLGYAPKVGAVRELTRELLSRSLAAAGFSDGAVRLEAPSVILVRRAAQLVDLAEIRAAVERVALGQFQGAGVAVRLVRLDLPPAVPAPAGTLEIRAALGGVRDLFAPFTAFVELRVGGQAVQRLSATAQLEVSAPVLVAARALAANERVRVADTRLETRRLERPLASYLFEVSRLRGYSIRRAVAASEALTSDLLVSEIVVRPGDTVRIMGASGALRVAVTGEARAAGRIGERIQVRNSQSGVALQAVVIDEGVVRVNF